MPWNWQEPDWPKFVWNQHRLALAEQQFLVGGGIFVGAIKHLGEQEHNELTVDTMSTEALTTSEIEGEMLDRASVQSSIQRHLGLPSDNRRAAPAERGVSEMMVALYKTFSEPLSAKRLFEMAPNAGKREAGSNPRWSLSH